MSNTKNEEFIMGIRPETNVANIEEVQTWERNWGISH